MTSFAVSWFSDFADRACCKRNSEVHKGGLVKGGLAIYAFPLCNCNTLGSVFNVEIENMPNCKTPLD